MSEDKQISPDRRLFERVQTQFPAKFKDTPDEFGSNVYLRDTSASGMRLTTNEQCYLHDSISLEIKLSGNNNPMTLQGKIVWTKSKEPHVWDMGIQFHKIDLLQMSNLYSSRENRFATT